MNPYETLEERAFWATAVARRNMFDITDLWQPKFRITPKHRIVTFGSCFAQHIGRALADRQFGWLDTEPAPLGLKPSLAAKFSYGLFSSRTGNIYTVSLLKQWCDWALGKGAVPGEIWQEGQHFFDPFRPRIEPNGFASPDEVTGSRLTTLKSFRKAILQSDVFVFTLGLSESWFNKSGGYEYPICPGTIAGAFDEKEHIFVNQDYAFIYETFEDAINLMRGVNPRLRFLLTVSPVPLTATNSGQHVLVATAQSKSVLRAVAGELALQHSFVDYFPSYEIISSAPFHGVFYDPNQRSVNRRGVEHVMDIFFEALGLPHGPVPAPAQPDEAGTTDLICEEELLEAFGNGTKGKGKNRTKATD